MEEARVAIVTGGAQGIGKAIAKSLLRDGCAVVLAETDQEAGAEAEEELKEEGEVLFVHTDIAVKAEVKRMVSQTVETFGRIDILVNNAGIGMELESPLEETSLDLWERVIGTNLTGQFLCAREAAPHLRKTRGCIVNIASTRAFMSEPGNEAYAASKGGVVALTHALAMSLGPNVRVNCISPGWIDVSGWKKRSHRKEEEIPEESRRQHPAGRIGKPEDIASLVSWLAKPGNDFVTGSNFVVDGGMTRKMIYV